MTPTRTDVTAAPRSSRSRTPSSLVFVYAGRGHHPFPVSFHPYPRRR